MLKLAVGTIVGSTLLLAGAAQAEIRVIYPPYAYQPRVSLWELSQVIYGPACCAHDMMAGPRHGGHHARYAEHAMMQPEQRAPVRQEPTAFSLTVEEDVLGP